ncbi:MAG: NHL domain/cytochrome c family protein, partial [Methyloprofundus sp.]|nr:NHL domain/cytochrome c family protein [Methyloprofundus sp.]
MMRYALIVLCLVLQVIFLKLVVAEEQIPIAEITTILADDFNQATGLAIDSTGLVYVLDGMNSRIVVFSASGKKQGEISAKSLGHDFTKAMSLAIQGSSLYIADSVRHRIIQLSLQGKWLRNITLTAPEKESLLPEPVALLVNEDHIIYSDRRWHRLCYLEVETAKQVRCIGERGEMKGQFQYPFQIAEDKDGYLNVVDVLNARIQVFDRSGRYYSQTGQFSVENFYRPNGNSFDALDFQYVSDAYLGGISIYQQGRFLGLLKDSAGKAFKFKTPVALQVDPAGYLYVLDSATQQLSKLVLSYQTLKAKPHKAQEVSRKNCVLCHYTWAEQADQEIVKDEQGILPVAALDMCVSCHHGAVFDSRQAIPHAVQHPTVYDKQDKKQARYDALPREDEMPELYPHTDKQDLNCASCHTPHNDNQAPQSLYKENHNAWLRGADYGSEQCEACHEKNTKYSGREHSQQFGINHPLGVKMHKPKAKKARHLETADAHLQKGLPKLLLNNGGALGEDDALVCQSCHQIHQGKTDNLLTLTDEAGQLCASCHQRQAPKDAKAARKAGVHPVNVELEEPVEIRGQKVTSVQCQSCHQVHNGTVGTELFPDKIKEAEALCVGCHERQHAKNEKEAKKKGIHPMNIEMEEPVKIAGYEVKTIGCLSCHSVHAGKPNTPVLHEEHRNGKLCENCHEGMQKVIGTDHDLRVTAKESQNQQEETPLHSGACGACHTLHKGSAALPFLSSVIGLDKQQRDETAPHLKRDELCLNCHQKEGLAKEKSIVDYGHPYQDMILSSDETIMPV